MGKEEGCRPQCRGGCNLSGAGIVITRPGEGEQWGEPPAPLGVDAAASFLFPQASSFVCVFIGGSGEFFCLLLFPFFFLFGLWLAPGWWGRVEGRRAGKEGLENFRRLAWDPDRDGICEEFVRGNLGAS